MNEPQTIDGLPHGTRERYLTILQNVVRLGVVPDGYRYEEDVSLVSENTLNFSSTLTQKSFVKFFNLNVPRAGEVIEICRGDFGFFFSEERMQDIFLDATFASNRAIMSEGVILLTYYSDFSLLSEP